MKRPLTPTMQKALADAQFWRWKGRWYCAQATIQTRRALRRRGLSDLNGELTVAGEQARAQVADATAVMGSAAPARLG